MFSIKDFRFQLSPLLCDALDVLQYSSYLNKTQVYRDSDMSCSPWSLSLIIWLLPLKGTLLSGREPWSICRKRNLYCLQSSFIFFVIAQTIMQCAFNFLQRSWIARRQEDTVGGHLDSLIHEKPPPPAVWWLWRAVAGRRLYAEIRRLPGWSWDLPCGGPGPHTCWGGGCLDGHSTGLAERNESGKSL